MDDDVANVQEHPVSVRHAFQLHRAARCILHRLREMISNSSDVARRTARRNDHDVGEGRFAFEVDDGDVFGLVILERADDGIGKRADIVNAGISGLEWLRMCSGQGFNSFYFDSWEHSTRGGPALAFLALRAQFGRGGPVERCLEVHPGRCLLVCQKRGIAFTQPMGGVSPRKW